MLSTFYIVNIIFFSTECCKIRLILQPGHCILSQAAKPFSINKYCLV